jgi:hypothetical protein
VLGQRPPGDARRGDGQRRRVRSNQAAGRAGGRGRGRRRIRDARRSGSGLDRDRRRGRPDRDAHLRRGRRIGSQLERGPRLRGERDAHAIAARRLGLVHGDVGCLDESHAGVPVLGIAGDAGREGRADAASAGVVLVEPEARALDLRAEALGGQARLLERRVGKQQAVLLAPEPRGHAGLAGDLLQRVGHAADHAVAGQVPAAVVDVAQVVEVGEDHREPPAGALGALELLLQALAEVLGVEQARLRVGPGLVLELRQREGAPDQRERAAGQEDQGRRLLPQRHEARAREAQGDVERQSVGDLMEVAPHALAARQARHEHEQQVVDHREDDGGDEQQHDAVHPAVRAGHPVGQR